MATDHGSIGPSKSSMFSHIWGLKNRALRIQATMSFHWKNILIYFDEMVHEKMSSQVRDTLIGGSVKGREHCYILFAWIIHVHRIPHGVDIT